MQFRRDFFDHHAGATGAFVVHRGDFLATARDRALLKDDHLRVLATKFDHGTNIWKRCFDNLADGGNFLNEAGAEQFRKVMPTTPGHKKADAFIGHAEFALRLLQDV